VNTATRLGAYAAGLALAFTGALGVGTAVGPVGAAASSPRSSDHSGDHGSDHNTGQDAMTTEHGAGTAAGTGHDGHDGGHAGGQPAQAGGAPGGLAVSQDGYTLVPAADTLPVGQPAAFRFTVTGPDGRPVTGYTPEHDKDLHLIVVRRDLSGFQHLHPSLGPDGVWSLPLTLPAAGDYRAFADFVPAAAGARPLTLGVDLHAAGAYTPRPLPASSRTATIDGYTVTLAGELLAGQSSPLTLTVSRDGRPVTDLQPYLAAYGHLVALRDGDLAYLHVHPEGHPGDGTTPAGPQIGFMAEVPTAGSYRLYLDFQHDGVVRTAEFTAQATGTAPAGSSGMPGPAASPVPTGPAPSPTPFPTARHGGDGHTH
jgi:hypothetical protein